MAAQVKRKREGGEDHLGMPNGAPEADPSWARARLGSSGGASSSSSASAYGAHLAGGAARGGGGADGVDMALLEKAEREAGKGGEGGAGGAGEALDLRGLRRLILGFEKKLKENEEARIRYAEQPERFMEGELELDAEIKKLRALSGAPQLYPDFVRLNASPSLLKLLAHENTDLAVEAVGVVAELTDADEVGEHEAEARVLVDALVASSGLELLAQNLARLNEGEPEEAQGVHHTLAVLENLVEVRPDVADLIGERTKVLRWLLQRVKAKEFDPNKQYASEILAILLQGSTANQRRVGQMNGVDMLLQAVALYKSRDPKTLEEEEMVENVFDALCSVVLLDENKERFVKSEGVELMIIVMKQKRVAYASAMKLLDFALTRWPPACERFVDVLGLKTLFAAFLGKIPVKRKSKAETSQMNQQLEERVVSILASLAMSLPRGSRRDRVLSKFVEKEYEKIDRLLELYIRYSERVKAEEQRQKESEENMEEGDEELITDEDKYLARLDAGLFTLQLLALILGQLFALDHLGIQERIDLLLKQQHLTRQHLRDILEEYHDNIGDMGGVEEKERRQTQVQDLIESL